MNCVTWRIYVFFFFFQAEDGIRDLTVTGVQTCALPIYGTWLSRAELQVNPESKRFGIGGEVLPPGFNLTGSLPWNRANFSLFYDGPPDTWMQGLDIGAVVHWVGQYEDDNVSLTGSPKLKIGRAHV